MSVDIENPVIWTSIGNINEDDVQKFVEWQDNDGVIVCIVGARLKSTGEEVKRAVYACPVGLIVTGVQHNLA